MPRWWSTATRTDRIAAVTLAVTVLGVIPAYAALVTNQRDQTSSQTKTQTTAEPTATTAQPTATTALPTDTLLSFLGNERSETCDISKHDSLFEDEIATAFCTPRGSVAYSMTLYETMFALYNDYNGWSIGRGNPPPVRQDPANCAVGKPSKGNWSYKNADNQDPVGRLTCYFQEGDAWIVWTYDKQKILAIASREDDNMRALYDWWDRLWSRKS
jgi:hypothetical protein